jgi:hypothetical protein
MHCSDDDLVLHYYDDPEAPAQTAAHLEACAACRDRFQELAASLRVMTLAEAPDPGDDYGRGLWRRLAPRLPERQPFWRGGWFGPGRLMTWQPLSWRTLSLAAAAAVLLVAGFVIGRVVPGPQPADTQAIDADADASRRVLLMSVTEHLERSDRVLTDVMNASIEGDISTERQWAADLVADNRFFRHDVRDSGEPSIAAVLDELERALLDIVHSPSDATPADLEEIHRRLDSAALLFKVRVLGGELRRQQLEPDTPPDSQPSISRIS